MQATPLFNLPPERLTCLGLATRTLCSDFIWRPMGDLAVGDELISFDGFPAKGHRRHTRISTVLALTALCHPAFRIRFADGRQIVASSELQWLRDPSGWWTYTRNITAGRLLRDLGTPWQTEDSWEAGWLGGVFDGEASLSAPAKTGWFISFAQNEGAVLELAKHLCAKRGYESRQKADKGRDVRRLVITGIYDCWRFLGECRPVRLIGRSGPWIERGTPVRSRGTARARRYSLAVEKVEYVGECDVVAIQTSTRSLLVEGMFGSLACTPMKP